jgi:2-methylcitrate dehydratase PrpD
MAAVTLAERLAAWASAVTFDDIPARVRDLARSQVVSQLAAARAGAQHELGRRVVRAFGPPLQEDPKRAAYVLAALTMALDYDDTVYAGHVTQSTVNAALAYARPLGLDGRALVTAVVVANECAARVTAAACLGRFRGQTAAHTHLAGGAAARLRAENAPAARWVDALTLAFAAPPWTLLRSFLGSEAKVFTAATPLLVALDACDAAAAGLGGAADVLEHEQGFLRSFAALPLPETIVRGLGERWHTDTVSFKVYPGSAYVDACVDCAVSLHQRIGSLDPAGIDEVVVTSSAFTVELARRGEPDGGSRSAISVNFSVAYNVATALLTGALEPRDLSPPRIDYRARWALAAKVRVEHDQELTRRAVRATAPIGEAIREAGPRALEWLEANGAAGAAELIDGVGPPSADFESAEKAIGARVLVRLSDGRELEERRDVAFGAVGSASRNDHASLVRAKFLRCGGPPAAADALQDLQQLSSGELAEAIALTLATERSDRATD